MSKPFGTDTNVGRVSKIVETCEKLKASAESRNSMQDDIDEVVKPAVAAMRELVGQQHPTVVVSQSPTPRPRAPQWATIREMAEQASLADLTVAMAVFLNRIDEMLKP